MALCTSQSSTEQKLEAMRWYFGARHCRSIVFASDDSDHGNYFELNTFNSSYVEQKYLVFLDDGIVAAPTPAAGQTLVSVSVTAGDSANDKALAMAAQFVTDSVEVRTEVDGAEIDIQNHFVGLITVEDTANAPDLTFDIGKAGFGGYLGQTGESELTTTTNKVQLVDDAQGTVVLDEIITGYEIELSLPLREMTKDRWESLIGSVAGSNVTIDGEDITGWGTAKVYQSMFQYAGRLVGHPVRLPASTISEDVTILNTAPNMDSLNFSGAAIQEGSFTFIAYKDANAQAEINLAAYGDHTKF